MTHVRSLIALAVLAGTASLASAQASAPASRADVKADARAAVKAGTTDEGDLSKKDVQGGRVSKTEGGSGTSGTSRSEVRSEAKDAVKKGTTAEGNLGGPAYNDRDRKAATMPTAGAATATTATGSTTSRAEVRSEAKDAVKKGTTAEGNLGGPNYDDRARNKSGSATTGSAPSR